MISITHLGNESQLSSQYPDIEEFYQNQLKLHRISVTDRLFLSVLELPAPSASESEPVTNVDQASTAPASDIDAAAAMKAEATPAGGTQPTAATENADDMLGVESAGASGAAMMMSILSSKAQDDSQLTAAEVAEEYLSSEQSNLAQDKQYSKEHSQADTAQANSLKVETFTNADIKSFWTQNEQTKDGTDTLVIVPGRAENEHKYAELLYNLRNSGLRVLVCFVRGQGQSSNVIYGSTKCHVEFFANYRHDLETMLNYMNVGSNYKLLGFSLGGLISLDFCFFGTYPYKPRALGLVSPFLGINYPFPPRPLYYTLALLCLFRGFALAYTPHGREYKRIAFEDNHHSHSMIRYNIYHDYYADHPQQAIAGPSFNFVKCCLRAQLKLCSKKVKFNFPVMCVSSELDKVVSVGAAQKFFELHKNDPVPPQFEVLKGAYHDVLNESDQFRNPALAKVFEFLFPGAVHMAETQVEQAAKQAAQQTAEQAANGEVLTQPLDGLGEELGEASYNLEASK